MSAERGRSRRRSRCVACSSRSSRSARAPARRPARRRRSSSAAPRPTPDPSCPELPCQAVGSVTGFQVSNGQAQLPFRVPHDGKIKSWTLTLAQPTSSQRSFFNGFFGTPPEARLAILRRVAGHQPAALQPAQPGLDPGAQPLPRPDGQVRRLLKVEKGDIVGLTVPTWAPAFAQGLAAEQRLARQPRAGQLHQLDRRPPGRTAAEGRHAAPPTAAVHDGAPALHGDPGRGLARPRAVRPALVAGLDAASG